MSDRNKQLCERVGQWRETLRNADPRWGSLVKLEQAWQAGSDDEAKEDREIPAWSNPFAAAMYHIQMGEYPPPEIMLTILDCWNEYLVNGDMERSFLGPPKPKAGNFAKRLHKFRRDVEIESQAVCLLRQNPDMTLAQVAEQIKKNLETESEVLVAAPNHRAPVNIPDADTIERYLHGKFKNRKAGK